MAEFGLFGAAKFPVCNFCNWLCFCIQHESIKHASHDVFVRPNHWEFKFSHLQTSPPYEVLLLCVLPEEHTLVCLLSVCFL